MILGSHNSMTYKTPVQWWLKPVKFLARCQEDNWIVQYNLGSRFYDIRLKYDNNGKLYFGHGFFKYDASDLHDFLYFIDKKATHNDIYMRILFEERSYDLKNKNRENNIEAFKLLCKDIHKIYPNINFLCGSSIQTHEVFYDFGYDSPITSEYYSSVTSLFKSKNSFLRIIDDFCPWLYAKINTRKKFKENKDKEGYLLLDFVNMIK